MNRLKHIAKNVAGQALLRTGLWHRHLERLARRGEAIILTYHRVIEKWNRTLDYSQPGMVVTADTFDRQLRFLKKYFDIVPLSTLINSQFEIVRLRASTVSSAEPRSRLEVRNSKSFVLSTLDPRPSTLDRPLCSITFDDGWRDNYEIAFPILQRHGASATIFLTTDFIGTNRTFWHTDLIYTLLHGELAQLRRPRRDLQAYPASVTPHLIRLARLARAPSAEDVDGLIEAMKDGCDEETIERLIRDFAAVLRRRPLFTDRTFFLDWDQVRELAASGIEIGSHGCSHRILTRLKVEEAEQELVRSKAEIERRIGRDVQHFAFPNGDVNQVLMALAGKAGYRTASLCGSGPDGGLFGPLALRRLGMAEAVSRAGNGSKFSQASLGLWIVRGTRP